MTKSSELAIRIELAVFMSYAREAKARSRFFLPFRRGWMPTALSSLTGIQRWVKWVIWANANGEMGLQKSHFRRASRDAVKEMNDDMMTGGRPKNEQKLICNFLFVNANRCVHSDTGGSGGSCTAPSRCASCGAVTKAVSLFPPPDAKWRHHRNE